jgi:hypothetical protein
VYKAVTKDLKLLRQIPIDQPVFMRPSPTGNYDPPDVIKSIWVINYWVIDIDVPASTSTSLASTSTSKHTAATKAATESVTIQPAFTSNDIEAQTAIKAADKYLSTASALVVMNPLENQALMRFTAMVSQENLSSKADILIDTAASLNFVSKRFLNANGFYKYCKTVPKLAVKVANEQCVMTDKIFCPLSFGIEGSDYQNLQFRVLPHFKSSDFILGLPALRDLDAIIHPSANEFTIANLDKSGQRASVPCHTEPRRIGCMIVDTNKMEKILIKQSRN